jgi:NitT/TauT family transport system ATP-binding protein
MSGLLKVDAVGHRYGPVAALEHVGLDVAEGEFVAICGPSGCGKTTLLEILSGLRQPSDGSVRLDGQVIDRPRPEIGVVFQEESTFPWRTVRRNAAFGLEALGVPRAEREQRVDEILRTVGLTDFADAYPAQLSGGMRQRVAIARTLVARPRVVVMDEPFSALDEQTRLLLGGELLRIVDETNATVVLVTHSIQEAALLSDRIVVLSARPARVRDVIVNPLPRPRDARALTTQEFADITRRIWTCLEDEAQRAYDAGAVAA